MSHCDTAENVIQSHSFESSSTSDIATCKVLLELFTNIPGDDFNLLHKRSLELLSAFERCKPDDRSISPTWHMLYDKYGIILSRLMELSIPLLYVYCRYLLLSYEREEHLPRIISLLERVIKVSPTISRAWNDLGESYWEIGQRKQALNCFLGAIQHDDQSKDGLRNLAIVYRQLEPPGTVKQSENIKLSMKYAQQAVDCDKSDGKSWMILGNVLLSEHFQYHNSSNILLKKCIICYRLAENDNLAKQCPDLYTNLGTVYICLEEYHSAIECYYEAVRLEPKSDFAISKLSSIIKTFRSIQLTLENCYKLSHFDLNIHARKCMLKIAIEKYTTTRYAELKPGDGMNTTTVINLTVLQTIMQDELVSCLAVCVDINATILICNLHSLKQNGLLKKSDVITVIAPSLKPQKIQTSCGIVITCPWISCNNHKHVMINGVFIGEQFIVNESLRIQAYT